jgi:hypothetical protein
VLAAAVTMVAVGGASCSNSSDGAATTDSSSSTVAATAGPRSSFVSAIRDAVAAVESERGGPQEYFEVTATTQSTNVFVAVDDGTAAVPYVYIGGVLAAPSPRLDGATGLTFGAADLTFDDSLLLSRIASELPNASIESVSVEGASIGKVRYVVSVRSTEGGTLEVVVGPDGKIQSVDPS